MSIQGIAFGNASEVLYCVKHNVRMSEPGDCTYCRLEEHSQMQMSQIQQTRSFIYNELISGSSLVLPLTVRDIRDTGMSMINGQIKKNRNKLLLLL